MPRLYRKTFLTALVAVLFVVPVQQSYADEDLWAALQEGGKVVLMRHAPVEKGPGKGSPLTRDPTCKTERNLSVQGREKAKAVGERFRAHQIPVSSVMHSPYCRTTDTARLAFGEASPAEYLSLLEVLGPESAQKQTAELKQVLRSHQGKGNLVLVTHEPNINAVSFEMMKHLDILVIQPGGQDGYEELGVIRFSEPG